MSTMFYEGYHPRGWRRGEHVHVEFPTDTSHGFVQRKSVRPTVVLVHPEPTYRVHFTRADEPRLCKWLLWWFEKDASETQKVREAFGIKAQ